VVLKEQVAQNLDPKGKIMPLDLSVTDFIGLDSKKNRLLFMGEGADFEENLSITKSTLKYFPNMTIHTNLIDAHMYIFSRWVLDLIEEKKDISSIKLDLIPNLIKNNFNEKHHLKK